jgi:hypothetical protein
LCAYALAAHHCNKVDSILHATVPVCSLIVASLEAVVAKELARSGGRLTTEDLVATLDATFSVSDGGCELRCMNHVIESDEDKDRQGLFVSWLAGCAL